MAQTIKLKRSANSNLTSGQGIPTTSNLELGEVAINTYHGKMYIKKDDGSESIVEIGGTAGTVTEAFKTIAVSGQTSVVADSATDTLTFVAGTNMSITTNASGDSITFASTGTSGSATFLGLSDTPANFTGAAGKYLKVNSSGNSVEFDTLNFNDLGTTPTTISGYGITDAFDGAFSSLTGKPTTISGYGITDAFDGAFSSLTGKPTTISGYGITDALQLGTTATTALAGNTSIPSALTDLGITDGSNGQVLQTDGNGNFSFVNSTGGNSFGTIAVSGQSNVVADQGNDTLTLVAGNNVTLTTNASGDSITIASSGSGSGSGLSSTFTLYEYTATSGQTTFSGSDGNSNTLAYDTGTPPKILVYLNGVLLDHTTDYTATNGTSVVLTNGAAANDLLQIAAYASSVSTNLDIDLSDDQKILFGDDDDFQIYHDGSTNNSVIKETGSGNLELWGNNVKIMNVAGTETQLNANPNGQVELYYDNSKKFETTSTGVTVTGQLTASTNLIATTATYSPIVYGGSSNLQLKSTTAEMFAQFVNNGAAELYYDNTKKFETTSYGADITGRLVTTSHIDAPDSARVRLGDGDDLMFYHDGTHSYIDNNTGSLYISSTASVQIEDNSGNDMITAGVAGAVTLFHNGSSKFATSSTGATLTGTLAVDSINLGDSDAINMGTSDDFQIYHDGSNSYVYDAGTGYLVLMSNGPGIRLNKSNAEVMLDATPDGAVSLYYDNAVKLATTSTGVDVTGSVTADSLVIDGAGIDTTTTSTTATTQVAIDTFAAATFRSARYTIQVTNSTDSTYHLTEVLLIHDGTTPQITEYGTIFTGSAEATFDADISSGSVRLLATPATTDSMTFKVVRHCITV